MDFHDVQLNLGVNDGFYKDIGHSDILTFRHSGTHSARCARAMAMDQGPARARDKGPKDKENKGTKGPKRPTND